MRQWHKIWPKNVTMTAVAFGALNCQESTVNIIFLDWLYPEIIKKKCTSSNNTSLWKPTSSALMHWLNTEHSHYQQSLWRALSNYIGSSYATNCWQWWQHAHDKANYNGHSTRSAANSKISYVWLNNEPWLQYFLSTYWVIRMRQVLLPIWNAGTFPVRNLQSTFQ